MGLAPVCRRTPVSFLIGLGYICHAKRISSLYPSIMSKGVSLKGVTETNLCLSTMPSLLGEASLISQ